MNSIISSDIESSSDLLVKIIDMLSKDNVNSNVYNELISVARLELEREFKDLERKKEAFNYEMDLKNKAYNEQMKLFDLKWKILEEETIRLAEETKKAEKRRAFFERVNTFQKDSSDYKDNIVHGEMFFKGIASQQALRKRYKDLIKIYHPDSECGDNQTVQEINREYATLRHAMAK